MPFIVILFIPQPCLRCFNPFLIAYALNLQMRIRPSSFAVANVLSGPAAIFLHPTNQLKKDWGTPEF